MGCPNEAELAAFAIGDLPKDRFAQVADHVERCLTCETCLQSLDRLEDSFLAYVRESARCDSTSGEQVPDELLERAQAAPRQTASPWQGPLPRQLDKFELLEELGSGSFGRVLRARDTELDREVALKILHGGRWAGADDVDRFLREARSAAHLKHAGIVSLYATGRMEDGTCYLVEELVPGQTLEQHLRDGPLEMRPAATLISEVAQVLDYAHRHGVIHRDVKPSNIIVDDQGRPHLMDFGLAKRDLDDSLMTLDGEVLGTPAYMSPEQARGNSRGVDARTDIYALGVVLYETLTGERPFRGNRRMLLLQVLEDEPRPPRRLNDRISRDLETICLKAMAKLPARRYATAGELADDLARFLRGEPIRARPVGHGERLWRWCWRNPVAAGLLVAVSLGSAFGLWFLSWLSGELVRQSALESAAQQAEMLERANTHYGTIVDQLLTSPEIRAKAERIPVPAKFLTDLGEDISLSESGMRVRHYSRFPFRTRTDGGPHDDFERDALQALEQNPRQPFHRFEDYENRASLRYATARPMRDTCVRCHNGHSDSIKRDWREGELGGVLEIIRPLDQDVGRIRQGLRGTFLLMTIISGGLLGLTALVLLAGRRRVA
jgi:hypothetical protein